MIVFLLYWLPFLLYSAAILTLSSHSHLPGAEELPDKWVHFAEYFLYAFLLGSALRQSLKHKIGVIACMTFFWGALFAALDEFYQSYIPGRQSSIFDWLADLTGITAMISLILWKQSRRRHPEHHEAS